MKYVVALSFCDEDADSAGLLFEMFTERRLSCYHYMKEPRVERLMFELHSIIYSVAMARIYFIRKHSFSRPYPKFELTCGKGRKNNFLIQMESSNQGTIPEAFLFVNDKGWTTFPRPTDRENWEQLVDSVCTSVRQV